MIRHEKIEVVKPSQEFVSNRRSSLDDIVSTSVFDVRIRVVQSAGPDVVRLSIGLEDKTDIIADLDQALAQVG